MIYKLVTRVIQYFFSPIDLLKVGTSWISRKGGILEKGGGDDLPYQVTLGREYSTLQKFSMFKFFPLIDELLF